MSRKPKTFLILSWLVAFTVLSIPFQIMALYEHDLSEVFDALDKVTSINWLVMISGVTTSVLIFRASPWARLAVPLTIALVGINNWVVGYYATDFSPLQTLSATALFASLHLPLLHPKFLSLLNHPERRWWMRADRKVVKVPMFIGGARNSALRAETFDLSESGAFIPLSSAQEHKYASGKKGELSVGETVAISMTLGSLSQVRCEGKVVRMVEARGMYPAGIGIQFTDVPPESRKELRRYLGRSPEMTM